MSAVSPRGAKGGTTVTVDRYTKIVLTIIALALMALVVQPYTLPRAAVAQGGVVDVRIRGIDEAPHFHWETINVHCDNCQ
jgi:hypothetical protein